MLLGMSQEKLGENLGLTFQQVQKYEKGVNRIGASRLFDLSRVLGVPIQFFYDEAPASMTQDEAVPGFNDAPAGSYVVEFLSTREGLDSIRLFRRFRIRKCAVRLSSSSVLLEGTRAANRSRGVAHSLSRACS